VAVDVRFLDGRGRPNFAKVNGEGELSVVVHPHPPKDEEENALPFRARFETAAASSNMAVDGSASAVLFSVNASTERDIYIKYISLTIGDNGSPALNKFGALAALTNGVKWTWDSQDLGEIVLHDGIKTNLEFIRTGNDTGAIGTGVDSYLADVSGGGTEKSYLPSIDMAELFGLAYGVRLRRGTTDRISFTVRDDLSTLVTFNAIAYGLQL
jgi:hypothetical protein